MARQTTAKPLTEEQKRLTAGIARLVNHFVRRNKLPFLSDADFRSEMFFAVVKGASQYNPAKGSFGTWSYRQMEWHTRTLRRSARPNAAQISDAVIWEISDLHDDFSAVDAKDFSDSFLSHIPNPGRKIVADHFIRERTFREISLEMGWEESRTRHLAMRAVHKALGRMNAA